MYLQQTCFNGVYRENRRGKFNMSYGRRPKVTMPTAPDVMAVSERLQGAELLDAASFEATLALAEPGDFVYLDPPYIDTHSAFTGAGFNLSHHERLADEVDRLTRLGVYVLLSGSDVPDTLSMYRSLRWQRVEAFRSVSCKSNGRKKVDELLGRNF